MSESTPAPEGEPTAPQPATDAAPEPAAPTAALPPTPPPAAAVAPGTPVTPYGAYPPPYSFAPPPPKPPRERWINPSKRVAFSVISIVAALVLLFVGAVIGHAVATHNGRFADHGIVRQRTGPFGGYGPGYGTGNGSNGGRQFPNQQRPRTVPSGSRTAQPAAPSATTTS